MKNIFKVSHFAITLAITTASTTTIPASFAKPTHQPIINQVPGYFHHKVGDFMVTALYDGDIYLSPSLLKGIEEKDIQTLLDRMFIMNEKEGVQPAVNAYLVNTKNGLVLIDSGSAKCFGPTMGPTGFEPVTYGLEGQFFMILGDFYRFHYISSF
ncbi:MBL fold metallo-hydrolase [Xenorhabdus szentirmaii]|uniref:hypothetical protein n=1 Tax=Xenorhabdus szentirmaii TaxID=290112 RepID=UPI0019A1F5A4|nr:hypothetical protein [Xenorhabdus sp. 38]MBD2780348.1 hypothetical protein [Xenorhabdus sp. 38]